MCIRALDTLSVFRRSWEANSDSDTADTETPDHGLSGGFTVLDLHDGADLDARLIERRHECLRVVEPAPRNTNSWPSSSSMAGVSSRSCNRPYARHLKR